MIKRIHVRNYKSLENLTLNLGPLTVLVGPNNSGKSNIMDVFQFLREFTQQGQGAITKRGGFPQIVWDGKLERGISLDIEGGIAIDSRQSQTFEYHVDLRGTNTDSWITEERFSLTTSKRGSQSLLEFPWGEVQMGLAFDEEGKEIGRISAGRERPYLAHFSNPEGYPFLGSFSEAVQSWKYFHLVPSKSMRNVSTSQGDLVLWEDGGNLASVLHTLQSQYRSHFHEIEDVIKTAVPGLVEVFSPIMPGGQTYISIREKGLTNPINSWAMSDGTLCFLGYLAILYGPSPPPLVCIEEPENFIHPRMLELLADVLRNGSERSQILITTHSPYLLNNFRSKDLVIVEKERGRTSTRRASRHRGIKEALEVLGLGEFWYSGALGGVPR